MDETKFVKSSRYSDGLYPSCKDCRKEVWKASLKNNPTCSRCGERPHTESHVYCYECQRETKGQPKVAKFRRDSKNTTLCSKCKIQPRLPYHGYCSGCQIEYNLKWMQGKGGMWKYLCEKGDRDKALARHSVNSHVRNGTMRREPCKICGDPEVQAHHYLGYDPEHYLDIVWLCKCHHIDADKGRIGFDNTDEGVVLAYKT